MTIRTPPHDRPAFRVREATPGDVASIAVLAEQFRQYLRGFGDPAPPELTAAQLMRDGFGPEAAFGVLVAEVDGTVKGYLLHCPWYDIDVGGRVLYVAGLFVTAAARRLGLARALMDAAAGLARERDAVSVAWTVYEPNRLAMDFYERVGAQVAEDMVIMRRGV